MAAPTTTSVSLLDANAVSPPESAPGGAAVELDSHPIESTTSAAEDENEGDESMEPMSRDVEGGAGWQRAEVGSPIL